MRRAAAVLLVLSACGSDPPADVPLSAFCGQVVGATCDREVPCGAFPDRATCVVDLTEAFDGCPLAVNAAAMEEADYDAAVARRLLDAIRAGACGSEVPLDVEGVPVFAPRLGAGAVCHSNVSCMAGLRCDNVTIATPQGTCNPL